MKRIFLMFIFAFSALSCQKELDIPTWNQEPVFFFEGFIDGTNHTFAAGVQDYYMHSGHTDTASLPREYFGLLTREGCAECPEQVNVRLRNHVVGELFNPDSSFQVGPHPFLEPYSPVQVNSRTYQFDAMLDSAEGQPITIYWDFGDGTTSDQPSPVHTYDLLSAPTIATCSLYVLYSSGCFDSSYQNIKLGSSCYASFEADVSGYSVSFTSQTQSSGISYSWDFGDGSNSNESNPVHQYQSGGVYSVKLTISDQGSGCESIYRKTIAVAVQPCLVNCHYEPVEVQGNNDWVQKKHMAIDFRDASGVLWSSEYSYQPDSSFINLTQAEQYLINENGNPTYHVNGEVNCLLFHPDLSDTLVLSGGTFSVAFGY